MLHPCETPRSYCRTSVVPTQSARIRPGVNALMSRAGGAALSQTSQDTTRVSLQRHFPMVHKRGGIAVRRGQILLSVFPRRRGDTHAREALSPSHRGCQASSPDYRPCSLFWRYTTHPIKVTSAPMAHQGRARQVSGRRRQPPYFRLIQKV
jgi:hypothetical protein